MRQFILLWVFFLLTPITILVSVGLFSYHTHKGGILSAVNLIDNRHIAYAALPTSQNVFEGSATLIDERVTVLENFLSIYHSPLSPFAASIITNADKYGIDYRLLPAIAMQETTLCQKTLPSAQYNCWGYGIWGKRITSFGSFEEAIATISHYFANKKAQGVDTLDAIGSIYNPGNTNHWKENVALFMSQI